MRNALNKFDITTRESIPYFTKKSVIVIVTFLVAKVLLHSLPDEWLVESSFTKAVAPFFPHPETLVEVLFWFVLIWLAAKAILLKRKSLQSGGIAEKENIVWGLADAIDAHSIVSISAPDGKLAYVNEHYIETFGYSAEELRESYNHHIYKNSANNEAYKTICEATKEGNSWSGKQRLRAKNGDDVATYSTIIPVKNHAGDLTHSVCIRSNITEAEIANSAKLMASFLGELQDGLYVFDTTTLLMNYANKSACTLSDWNELDVPKKRITDSSKWFAEDLFWIGVGTPLLEGKSQVVTVEVEHEKGPVEISTRLSNTPCGRQVFLSVVRDISSQKKLEQVRMESVSEISHELRTPLTSIKGALRLIECEAGGEIPGSAKKILTIASRNANRLLSIVNDILDFQKLATGKIECNLEPMDLSELLKEAVQVNTGFSSEHQVNLEYAPMTTIALVSGDRSRLMQSVTNLVSNAVKYSPKDETVRLGLEDLGEYWRVSVTDRGPGVPEDAKIMIFSRFGQVEASDGVKRSGTGLGLPICQRIIEIHKGKIDFRSVVGEGSEFYFDLPKLTNSLLKAEDLDLVG
jgi:PAS domain S-box-containing protein